MSEKTEAQKKAEALFNKEVDAFFVDPLVRKAIRKAEKIPPNPGRMKTTYSLLDERKSVLARKENNDCFAGLPKLLSMKSKAKYIRYVPYHDEHNVLTDEERCQWVRLCQEAGLLGREVSAEEALDEGMGILFDIEDPDLYANRLYMCLCLLRWLKENPSLVKAALCLVEEGGRDFWAAVAFCHYKHANSLDQSILGYRGPYFNSPFTKNSHRNLSLVLRLHHVANNPSAFDQRQIKEAVNNWQGWKWQTGSLANTKKHLLKSRLMLLCDDLFPLFGSRDAAEAEGLIEKLKRSSSVVKFEDSASK